MPLAELFDRLVAGGYGRDPIDIARRLTRRQILRLHAAVERRRDRQRADMIEAVAVAWGGKPAEHIERLRKS
ncbi:hypothetical protein PRZ61_12250 [Halomonas pacifica]|uniref:hypothetical protein n=1 Tax=Bisbaumannia pacifica TaxID=77098 RepID=UPI00235836D7|nr:hypothetical protein [Halomonas pacifica]MDC8804213.1 hypothetical protein [Halomonas pacifica]